MARRRHPERTLRPPGPAGALEVDGAGPGPAPLAPRPAIVSTRLTVLGVVALLALHWGLAVTSLVRENPTVDEVLHLPAGVSYWQTGQFKLYHHNPPLVRMVAALPVVLAQPEMGTLYAPTQGRTGTLPSYWASDPPNKAGFGHEFARLNAARFFALFTLARLLMPTFAVLGGLAVFAWSRALYGNAGGLLSLAVYCLCPNLLAHGRLITTDAAAAAFMLGSTFLFWRYLQAPSWARASLAGVALGMTQLIKFSGLLLYGIWPAIAVMVLLERWWQAGGLAGWMPVRRLLTQGAAIVALSVLVINLGYGFEGFGTPLGSFRFVSRSLTRDRVPVPPGPEAPFDLYRELRLLRQNRFQGTPLAVLPVPLPREYLLGFDDQKFEAEGAPLRVADRRAPADAVSGYPVYLDGVLRDQSWWYYYLLCLVYKLPEGTWLLLLASLGVLLLAPRARAAWSAEFAVLLVPAVVLGVMSILTNINLGLRYVLPALPFLYVAAGKLAPWVAGLTGTPRRLGTGLVGLGLGATALATLLIHPHYLAYFNVLSGGPARGSEHLIDSNLDWGQDLVGLKRWLDVNAPGERVGIAYFGQITPGIFNERSEPLDWYLPPALPGTWGERPPRRYAGPAASQPPGPGLYAVSASLVRGLPWRVYDALQPGANPAVAWAPIEARANAFSYFAGLEPIATIGHSIFVYRITPEQAAALAPLWRGS